LKYDLILPVRWVSCMLTAEQRRIICEYQFGDI